MHLSAFEISKFPEILPLLLILLLDFCQYGFWMYRKSWAYGSYICRILYWCYFQLSCKFVAGVHSKVKHPLPHQSWTTQVLHCERIWSDWIFLCLKFRRKGSSLVQMGSSDKPMDEQLQELWEKQGENIGVPQGVCDLLNLAPAHKRARETQEHMRALIA